MSTSDVNSLSSDASLIPALSGGAAVVAGPPGSLGWANGPAASSEVAGGTNLLVFVHALRRHWLAAMFLGVICGATLGWLAYVFRAPQYMATASLQVSAGKPIIMYKTAETEMASGHDYFDIYKDTQKSLLKSPLVIEAALRPPEINALPSVQRNETNAVGWLTNELNVNFATVNSEIMNVSLIGDNPQEITTLVNAVVSAYLSKIVDKEREKSVAHCDTLDGLRADKETEVRALLNNLRQLAEQAGGTGDKEALSIRQRVAVEQFAQYRSELMRVQFELMRARSSLKTQQAYLASLEDADIPAWEVDQYALADPTSRDLQLKLSYYNTNVAQFRNIIVPGRKLPPAVQKIESDRDVVQQQIDEIGKGYRDKIRERKRSEAEKEIRRAEAEVAVLTDQEQHFQADTEQQRKEIEKIGGQSIEIEMDRAKLKNIEEVLASVASERERLRVELMSAPRVNAIGKCEEPKEEYRRGMRLAIIGLAGMMGFCLPVFGVMLWDVRSRRVNAVSEVARGLGLSVIGSVPAIPAQVLRRLGSDSRRSQIWRLRLTESIDGIAARLLHKAERDRARVVLVSSAMPGEGKTTLATQLAMSLARHLRRTVLVDFDLRRPALDGVFGVPLEPGVCDALCGRGDIAGMIHPTGTDCLSVLPAGRWGREAMAALANGGGGPLFKQLREKYDFVIIDSSPVLPVADTRFVSQHADTVVLSVFRDVSEVPKIQATCEILDAFGVRDLETVVTGGSGFSYGRGRQYQAGVTT